jgi:hypothetical protein
MYTCLSLFVSVFVSLSISPAEDKMQQHALVAFLHVAELSGLLAHAAMLAHVLRSGLRFPVE